MQNQSAAEFPPFRDHSMNNKFMRKSNTRQQRRQVEGPTIEA